MLHHNVADNERKALEEPHRVDVRRRSFIVDEVVRDTVQVASD